MIHVIDPDTGEHEPELCGAPARAVVQTIVRVILLAGREARRDLKLHVTEVITNVGEGLMLELVQPDKDPVRLYLILGMTADEWRENSPIAPFNLPTH